jgi:hypothetical protein
MTRFNKKLNKALDSIGETAPAAPVKPAPSKPREKPKERPPLWRPKPQPGVQPKNYTEEDEEIMEDYEDESHPSTVSFWRDLPSNKSHAFGQHPLFALYGDKLSRESWGHTKDKAQASQGNMNDLMRLMQQVMSIEQQHESELVDLAKRITVQIWNVPKEMLRGDLTQDVEVNSESDRNYGQESEGDVDPNLLKQINKRITMNAMTQGSAVHAMLTLHHLVDREINAIDPRLLDLYNKLSSLSHQYYWLVDIPAMLDMLGISAVGSTKVNYDEGGAPNIDSRAIVFPILAQEMSKGVAELLSHHGLDIDDDQKQQVLDRADDIRLEPYLIQIGPALWRKFLKVRPRDIELAEIIRSLLFKIRMICNRLLWLW